jgi:Tfp pilus assembly protein PilX
MMHTAEGSPQRARAGERGVALVSVMFFTMMMLTLSAALLTTSMSETQVSTNYVAQAQAFYVAEAGLEQAKAWLTLNRTDTDLMTALLVEGQNANPDQSSLTRPDATVVATPLGSQAFATSTYDVVIRDNADDADPLTDSDGRWIITAQGGGPANASELIEIEVMESAGAVPSGAVSSRGSDVNVDFDQSGGGPGSRIPPNSFDGSPHDLNGNPVAPGGSCAAVPPLATDGIVAASKFLDEFGDLRSNVVKRANAECDLGGQPACPPGTTGCCTPGLWWIRGSAATPRFDEHAEASYNLLDLSTPELHAIDADYVTITQPPTVVLPAPATSPFDGAAGNSADPLLELVTQAGMQTDVAAVQGLIGRYAAGDTIDISADDFTGGGTFTYGTSTAPKLVTANADLRIRNGTTFTGFGILFVDKLLDIRDSVFNWTGIVFVQGNNPNLESRSSAGQLNGALYFNAVAGKPALDMDKNTDNLAITYSCEALALAASVAPTRTVGWIQLHQ